MSHIFMWFDWYLCATTTDARKGHWSTMSLQLGWLFQLERYNSQGWTIIFWREVGVFFIKKIFSQHHINVVQGSFLMLGSMCLDNVMFFLGLHCMNFFLLCAMQELLCLFLLVSFGGGGSCLIPPTHTHTHKIWWSIQVAMMLCLK